LGNADADRAPRPAGSCTRRRLAALALVAVAGSGLASGDRAVGALATSRPHAPRLVARLAAPLLLPAQQEAAPAPARDACCSALVTTLDGVLGAQHDPSGPPERHASSPTCRLDAGGSSVRTRSTTDRDGPWTCTLRDPAGAHDVVLRTPLAPATGWRSAS